MGILSKKEKEVERPFSLQGKYDILKWYQDKNDLLCNSDILRGFLEDYENSLVWLPGQQNNEGLERLEALQEAFLSEEWIYLGNVIKLFYGTNLSNLIEYFLVWCELPEMIEQMAIDRIYQFKRELGKVNDKVNAKRQKIASYRPVGNGY
jgi:hypothetical protein